MPLFERPKPQMGTQGDVVPRRIGAFVVNLIIVAVFGGLVTGALSLSPEAGSGVIGLLLLLYFIVFEGTYGKTPGKHLLGLVVVTRRGSPASTVRLPSARSCASSTVFPGRSTLWGSLPST